VLAGPRGAGVSTKKSSEITIGQPSCPTDAASCILVDI
jgi:hypothetical protein